jgi:hypothetical protein
VSDRWLLFKTAGSAKFSKGEHIALWAMTEDSTDKAMKLCELIVTRENV